MTYNYAASILSSLSTSSLSVSCPYILFSFGGMTIGFTTRSQTVSEGDAPPGDLFQVLIDIATLRTSEMDLGILFIISRSHGNPAMVTVSSQLQDYSASEYDAIFHSEGFGHNPYDYLEYYILQPNQNTIPSLMSFVINDIRSELQECYTIRISGFFYYEYTIVCNSSEDATEYFCYHTICIDDDDDGTCIVCNAIVFVHSHNILYPHRVLYC